MFPLNPKRGGNVIDFIKYFMLYFGVKFQNIKEKEKTERKTLVGK